MFWPESTFSHSNFPRFQDIFLLFFQAISWSISISSWSIRKLNWGHLVRYSIDLRPGLCHDMDHDMILCAETTFFLKFKVKKYHMNHNIYVAFPSNLKHHHNRSLNSSQKNRITSIITIKPAISTVPKRGRSKARYPYGQWGQRSTQRRSMRRPQKTPQTPHPSNFKSSIGSRFTMVVLCLFLTTPPPPKKKNKP